MRLRLLAPTAVAVALLSLASTSIAATQPDPVGVGRKGDKATRGFSSALALFVQAPNGFVRGCCYDSRSGEWVGPAFRPSLNPSIIGNARIDWEVGFYRGAQSTAVRARSAGWANFPELSSAARKVRHVVGGRTVGTLKAFASVDAEPAPGARRQGAVSIDLGNKLKATALFTAADPAADDTGAAGTISIDGKPASQWNREMVDAAIAGVYIEGNLPPKNVKASAAGKAVKGKVTDFAGHPLAQAKLTLQKRKGGKWAKARKGTTKNTGSYKLSASGAGQYRVVVTVGGTSKKSRAVRVA